MGFRGRKSYYLIVIILSHCFIIIILYLGLLDLCIKTKRICKKRSEGKRGVEGGGREEGREEGRGEERKRRQYDYENLLQKVTVF